MSDFFYKSSEPATVAIVREFYFQKDVLIAQMTVLGSLLGGKVAPMRDITSHFAGGVKLTGGAEQDAHWCRPDDYGYRSLRSTAKLAKGISKEDRAAIRAEHKRLIDLWEEHCPKRLSTHEYWQRLGVNTGNLLMSGGLKLELDGTAYFHLGFQIDEAEHLTKVAAGKPTCGWIDGAVEILASEYESARKAKLKAVEVSNA
ncbi:hypothetical protein FQ186_13115 [Pseudomonas sp. ANT_H14]|uniref:hypothetical protein n=1 Tax=unclassified Pseudomonas TaxID=196821 RepID=UPI0011EC2F0E|nr:MULTISPECIES: hypothetical protein [unclassified Pseudomonas]KAA0948080.1 hypothetical protein FQ182_06535 [Pseudomonas sp. ANT_H4]KAA0952120.1 hypothetical protein FQ186_13115 [Pseudomonas sp. ANT_H14]